ncbi:MAG TPA: UDP-glucose/GDP-mannose dehydrogenase family protein [Polyangiaceae bacterium]|nr:UDP-glucose/GDP-mannose dehydrogenase family protein [Polyangiaceae bacterium]
MRVAVVGTGYVGLVAGVCLAESGADVVCIDVDRAKLDLLEKGEVPFFEPGLADMLSRNWPQRITFSADLAASIRGRQVVFVAVGTPPREDGSADLSRVLEVARGVAAAAEHPLVLVMKSTVPVGTNQKVSEVVASAKHPISVVSNPEFLKEGAAIDDFLKPDRIVVGTDDDGAFQLMEQLYAPFNRQRNRLQRMSPKSAEIVKYAANALLATKISFMNEIAELCTVAGGDVEHVRLALGADRRIGYQFLYPGLGFGGSCFPKDLRALVRTGEELGVPIRVARAAVEANQRPVQQLLAHMERDLGGLAKATVAVWGLAFKPKTDDVREAPALYLIEGLVAAGANVVASDPEALETSRAHLQHVGLAGKVRLTKDYYAACEGADALVVATEWLQYQSPDIERIARSMKRRFVFDGRNVLSPSGFKQAGFKYRGIGRC